MTRRKPFTVDERRRISDTQYGHRARNAWGAGDLPAPFAEGDVVKLVGTVADDRLRDEPGRMFDGAEHFVICYGPSIDEGDAWYFRVATFDSCSDRLHVAWADRSDFPEDLNYMEAFELVETADPDGLAERERLLAEGWSYEPTPKCPHCGRDTR